jgi:DNA polymerase III alpha subunit (gram-positive type)
MIPAEAARIQGITTEHTLEHGSPRPPWSATSSSSGDAATLVAHNITFDHRIMAIAIARVARIWARLPPGLHNGEDSEHLLPL